MTRDEFQNLKRGDIVRHVMDAQSYVVTETCRNRVTAVRTIELTNPVEWLLVVKDGKRIDDNLDGG